MTYENPGAAEWQQLASVCPHDCPSTCALEIEVADNRIGRVRGAKDNTYTDGVICSKVARYAERVNHPDRLLKPLRRKGAKGAGDWQTIGWSDALDEIAERFERDAARHGSEAIWPYFYAGTMGLVQRDSIDRLRNAKGYSDQFSTICVNNAWTGFAAGTGTLRGPDPREMAKSDCVVIWGTNAVATQVNVMTHAVKARKQRGAKIVVVDVYHNATMKQADLALCLRPGTDGALACALMHCLFRDGTADRDFMARFADDPAGLEAHLADKTPGWAAQITGLDTEEIETFTALLGATPRSYLRLGYGFTRCRNGATAMHAANSIATVLGAWQYEGGGAFHSNSDIYGLDSCLIKGREYHDPDIRALDQSRIGAVLCGDAEALLGGPPVTAMLVQNTNPMSVAPEQARVREGFMRDDLFVAVHEQFMSETVELADIVLPATMFVEHDDVYRGGGHQHILFGPKLVDAPGECRSNLHVIEELARRLGVADKSGFGLNERQLIDDLLKRSGRGDLAALERERWIDCQPDFETSHFTNGFAWSDGKFRFRADWTGIATMRPPKTAGLQGPIADMPQWPDHWENRENADAAHPFRLVTAPARNFLNSTFNRSASSRSREGEPSVLMQSGDADTHGFRDGDEAILFNQRGSVRLSVRITHEGQRGTLIAEGLRRNSSHADGQGINTLTSADKIAPHGGAAFHDVKVGLRKST